MRRWTAPTRELAVLLAMLLAGCGAAPGPSSAGPPAPLSSVSLPSRAPTPSGTIFPGLGGVTPAPGSSSALYSPNPGAIVVAIDPGHGGCLDWGVPNPYDNTLAKSEKADTLAIGLDLRDRLRAQGVTVVMTRTADVALAGADYPPLGCHDAPWRDVNGDGQVGFGPGVPANTNARDELSARLDLANLVRADVLVSIHINSMTQNGVVYKIAATESFYTDETPWGTGPAARLAQLVQASVVASMGRAASGYRRQDRGIEAKNLYIVAPTSSTGRPGEPRRGALMPSILTEVGSMSLPAESELLASRQGREAAAAGIYDGLVRYFADRPLAARIDALLPGGEAGIQPPVASGSGPPFWAPLIPGARGDRRVTVRLTNTGTQRWPTLQLAIGWFASAQPYLGMPPRVSPADVSLPSLAPGESTLLDLLLRPPNAQSRQVAWITVTDGTRALSQLGSPPLQLATSGP
ncbi:MAG: N-acetylmuramoyl-L-alanine amidase family protein [Candidatus Limnocylindria bacterium]